MVTTSVAVKAIVSYYEAGVDAEVMHAPGLGLSTLTRQLRAAIVVINERHGLDTGSECELAITTGRVRVRDIRHWCEDAVTSSFSRACSRHVYGPVSHLAACSWIENSIVWIDAQAVPAATAAAIILLQLERVLGPRRAIVGGDQLLARLGCVLFIRGHLWTQTHKHTLGLYQQQQQQHSHRWVCDGCNAKFKGEIQAGAALRFRCTRGCDFDMCHRCVSGDLRFMVPRPYPPAPHSASDTVVVAGGHGCCLEVLDRGGTGAQWICDLCEHTFEAEVCRLHCARGCDWDACRECWPYLLALQ